MRSLRDMPAAAHPLHDDDGESSPSNPLDEPTLPLGQNPI
jgi:hypothetical protein